jgi:hypothetical protein
MGGWWGEIKKKKKKCFFFGICRIWIWDGRKVLGGMRGSGGMIWKKRYSVGRANGGDVVMGEDSIRMKGVLEVYIMEL